MRVAAGRDKAFRMRPLRAFAAMALIGWLGAWLTYAPATAPRSSAPVVARAAATTTSTVAPTTTTSTTVAPRPVVRASRSSVRPRPRVAVDEATRQRVIAAIYKYSDWDPARMVRVASCESGLNPWAVNGSHHGIFQIVGATLGLIDEHVALAHSMWQKRGMRPWQCKG